MQKAPTTTHHSNFFHPTWTVIIPAEDFDALKAREIRQNTTPRQNHNQTERQNRVHPVQVLAP